MGSISVTIRREQAPLKLKAHVWLRVLFLTGQAASPSNILKDHYYSLK